MSSPSASQNTYPYQNEPTWSKSEKAIARTAFDAALKRVTERRNEIDRKYDYRVFATDAGVWETLVRKATRGGRVGRVREDKLKPIRSLAKFLAENTTA